MLSENIKDKEIIKFHHHFIYVIDMMMEFFIIHQFIIYKNLTILGYYLAGL